MLVGGVAVLHIVILHRTGRNNPLGVRSSTDKVPFHRYFSIKDLVGFVVITSIIMGLVLFLPLLLVEPDNFILANPLSTPAHIVPE